MKPQQAPNVEKVL